MPQLYQVLDQSTIQEAAQTLKQIECVAVVRKQGSKIDQVPPVFVGDEALVFCAWQSND